MNTEKLTESIDRIVQHVEENIIGRLANRLADKRYRNIETLLEYVLRAGGGNHLEIGSLFGGSAIAVALLMKEFKLPGMVVCVDPLDGYYIQKFPSKDMVDLQSGKPVTPETFFENVKLFDVGDRILMNRAYSPNYTILQSDIRFSTAFIDGNHDGDAPLRDVRLVSNITTRYIIFDNYDSYHPDVKDACHILGDMRKWDLVESKGIVSVYEHS